MQNLMRVSKVQDLPLERSTLYKWHHTQRCPEIFVKLGGALFVELDRLEQLIDASRASAAGAMNRKRKPKKRSQAGEASEPTAPAGAAEEMPA
jgi:hypothetical protein